MGEALAWLPAPHAIGAATVAAMGAAAVALALGRGEGSSDPGSIVVDGAMVRHNPLFSCGSVIHGGANQTDSAGQARQIWGDSPEPKHEQTNSVVLVPT